MTPEALERWRYWQRHYKKLLAKNPRVVSRRRRHKRPAAAAPTTPERKIPAKEPRPILRSLTPAPAPSAPPKVLSDEQRLELLKVRASAPRSPRPRKPKAVSPVAGGPELVATGGDVEPRVKPPPPASVKPPAEREPMGIGFCNDCRKRDELFRHKVYSLCRSCHPYGGQLEAA